MTKMKTDLPSLKPVKTGSVGQISGSTHQIANACDDRNSPKVD